MQHGTIPAAWHREIRIGKTVLDLNTWALNVRYDMLCNVIGSGNITKHLSKNENLLNKIKLAKSVKIPTSYERSEGKKRESVY